MARSKKSSSLSLFDSIKKTQGSAFVLAKAQESIQIRNQIAAMPTFRGVTFDVTPIKEGKITILLASPSALTRAKHSIPSVLNHLAENGWNVTEILLKIQTKSIPQDSYTQKAPKPGFGRAAKKAWAELQQSTTHPDLKRAVDKLCSHHKLSDTKDSQSI